jgi:hypothetical protein
VTDPRATNSHTSGFHRRSLGDRLETLLQPVDVSDGAEAAVLPSPAEDRS